MRSLLLSSKVPLLLASSASPNVLKSNGGLYNAYCSLSIKLAFGLICTGFFFSVRLFLQELQGSIHKSNLLKKKKATKLGEGRGRDIWKAKVFSLRQYQLLERQPLTFKFEIQFYV